MKNYTIERRCVILTIIMIIVFGNLIILIKNRNIGYESSATKKRVIQKEAPRESHISWKDGQLISHRRMDFYAA